MKLPMLPADKANHFVYGAAVFAVVAVIATLIGVDVARMLALWVVVMVSALKEFIDSHANAIAEEAGLPPPHGVEVWDAMATIAGALVVCVAAEWSR